MTTRILNEEDDKQLKALISAIAAHFHTNYDNIEVCANHGPSYGPWKELKDEFLKANPGWNAQDDNRRAKEPFDAEMTAFLDDMHRQQNTERNWGCLWAFLFWSIAISIAVFFAVWAT